MKRRPDTGKWEVRWRDGGRNRSKSFTRKSDADRFKREVDQAREVGKPLEHDRGRELLAEFVEIWWERHVIPECSRSTQGGYLAIWSKHIRPRLGGYRLRRDHPARGGPVQGRSYRGQGRHLGGPESACHRVRDLHLRRAVGVRRQESRAGQFGYRSTIAPTTSASRHQRPSRRCGPSLSGKGSR